MYLDHFGFREKPFSIAPDPRYLYMSERHREALAHLIYGVKTEGGFVLLSGEVGTGKTTVCRCLLEQLPETSHVAFIINPRLTVVELLATICDEFSLQYPAGNTSIKVFVDLINHYLLDANRNGFKPVLIIDEAQNLSTEVLEQIRLLTNLETNQRKLLQIILLGQPELRTKLAMPELRQLKQRITASYHLGPLSKDEVTSYIQHRLAIAGVRRTIFPPATVKRIYKLSAGIPRIINLLCDRALLGAYAEGLPKITNQTIKKASREIFAEVKTPRLTGNNGARWFWVTMLALLCGGATLTAYYNYDALKLSTPLSGFFASEVGPDTATGDIAEQAGSPNDLNEGPEEKQSAEVQNDTPQAENIVEAAALIKPKPEKQKTKQNPKPPAPPLKPIKIKEGSTVAAAVQKPVNIDNSAKNKGEQPPLSSPSKQPAALAPIAWPAGRPAMSQSKITAFQALFKEWGLQYEPSPKNTACRQAKIHNLNCLFRKGKLDDLRKINRPAVLILKNKDGQQYYVLIKGLAQQSATLVIGKEKKTVAVKELESFWSGSYTIFWRTPQGYQGAIRPGYLVPWIGWLEQKLAAIGGRKTLPRNNKLLEGELLQEVVDFQRANNLVPDGILGPQTIIHLNSAADTIVPKIVKEPGTVLGP